MKVKTFYWCLLSTNLKHILTTPKAKRSLGQHFITNPFIGQKVANLLTHEGEAYHNILEVGPGNGILTQALLDKKAAGTSLKAVELDNYWGAWLVNAFPELKNNLFQQNVLDLNFIKVFEEQPWGLVGNFPYNVASQIILKAASTHELIPEIAGMFQLEVAKRLAASPGSREYGVLSVLFQAFYDVKLAFKLPPGAFNPPPKVHSAVIHGLHRPANQIVAPFGWLKQVVKQAFNQRRKKVSNTLKVYRDLLEEEDPGILDKRPEALSPDCYQRLALRIGQTLDWHRE